MLDGNSTERYRKSGTASGRGAGKRVIRKNRIGGNRHSGDKEQCVCLSCGFRMTHRPGMPYFNLSCPKCSSEMVKVLKFHLMGE